MMMLTGPIPATKRVLDRAGLKIDDIDAYEVNEAFASVPLAWAAELGADAVKLNPRGGAIALATPSARPARVCLARSLTSSRRRAVATVWR